MKALKAYFKTSGTSQYRLAKRLKVDRSAVSRWVSGKRKPAREQLIALSAITGIKIEDLL